MALSNIHARTLLAMLAAFVVNIDAEARADDFQFELQIKKQIQTMERSERWHQPDPDQRRDRGHVRLEVLRHSDVIQALRPRDLGYTWAGFRKVGSRTEPYWYKLVRDQLDAVYYVDSRNCKWRTRSREDIFAFPFDWTCDGRKGSARVDRTHDEADGSWTTRIELTTPGSRRQQIQRSCRAVEEISRHQRRNEIIRVECRDTTLRERTEVGAYEWYISRSLGQVTRLVNRRSGVPEVVDELVTW